MTVHFAVWFARWSLFIIYFWFGVLKVFDVSPANPLIAALLERTLPFLRFEQFMIGFGVYEMVIGILFLLPKYKRLLMVLFGLHMIMTAGPLVLLPPIAWQSMWVPTLEGQYMIKNIIIIALALTIWAHPTRDEERLLR